MPYKSTKNSQGISDKSSLLKKCQWGDFLVVVFLIFE